MLALALILLVAGLLLIAGSLHSRYQRWMDAYASLGREQAETAGRLRTIESKFPQPMVMMDARGLIRRVNPEAEALLGYEEQELLGHNILRILPIAPSARNASPLSGRATARIAAEGMHRAETEIRRKDGSRMFVHMTGTRAESEGASDLYMFFERVGENAAGSAIGALGMSPDGARSGLGTLERVVGRIVGQFEELLTTINGYGELARYGTPADSPVRKDLEEIVAAGERASHLARNLMAFSGTQLIPLAAVDLNEIVKQIAGELGVPLELNLTQDVPLSMANAECLRQVIFVLAEGAHLRMANLAGALLKFGTKACTLAEPKPTHSGYAPAGSYGVISISDQGAALGAEVLAHMFEPLYLNQEALGVDLSPIYGIVHSMGGRIDVRSAESEGTTFEILLPMATEETKGSGERVLNGPAHFAAGA